MKSVKPYFLRREMGLFAFSPSPFPSPCLRRGEGWVRGLEKELHQKRGDGYVTFYSQIEHGHYLCNFRLDIEIATGQNSSIANKFKDDFTPFLGRRIQVKLQGRGRRSAGKAF